MEPGVVHVCIAWGAEGAEGVLRGGTTRGGGWAHSGDTVAPREPADMAGRRTTTSAAGSMRGLWARPEAAATEGSYRYLSDGAALRGGSAGGARAVAGPFGPFAGGATRALPKRPSSRTIIDSRDIIRCSSWSVRCCT